MAGNSRNSAPGIAPTIDNIQPQAGSNASVANKWISPEGKLVDQQTDGAIPVRANTSIYRSINGKISTNPSDGILTSLTVEAKIQAGIDSLQQELAEAKQQGKSSQFWAKIYTSIVNRPHSIPISENHTDEQIIALAVAADNIPGLGTGPTNQTANTPTPSTSNATTNVNPSSTPVNNNTTTTGSSSTANTIPSAPKPHVTTNQSTIDALMAQLNGTRITDVTVSPNTSGWTSISRVRRRSKAGFAVEVPIISLSKILTNQSLKSIVRLSQSLEANKNNPVGAVAAIYGYKSLRTNGIKPGGVIRAKLKAKAFRLGAGRKPEKVAKAMNDAITFYTDVLKNITKENGFDDKTTQFKTQFLQQLVSVNNAYMTRGAEGYVSNMIDTPPPTAIGTQTQATPIGQRASIS